MPGAEPTYVHVDRFAVNKTFDTKFKSSLPKLMQKVATKAVDRSKKLTTKKPKDKGQEGFYLTGGVTKLVKAEKDGQLLLAAEVKLAMATWPRKSMFAFPSAKAKVQVANESEVDGGVEDLVVALIQSVTKDQVVRTFEKRAK